MIGHTFAHYRIEEEIGAGGMGLLYRAHDLTLGRDVALKVLAPAVQADEAARSRLVREAQTASALSHPYICTVFEVGQADGRVYIAMELVAGRSLQQMLSDGPLDPASAIRYGGQVAEALAHAHERGVIHRDLKSANVMITPEGRAKVLDFGLARRTAPAVAAGTAAAGSIAATLESPVRLTAEGMLMGTPYAIAPELLRGAEADARSDVWALGVLLHEVVSGRAPFAGETVFELSAAILHQPPSALPHQVSPGLASVIGRCLAKEPSQRYQRASEVHAALEALGSSDRLPSPVEVGAKPSPGRFRAGRALVVGAALWSLGIGALALDLGGLRTRWVGGARSPRIRSLAVLPLANLSKEADQEYFAEGTTEALTTALAQIGALRVISRTSAMRYKDTRRSIGEIARDLGVDAVIEGSVARAGDRVRITAQLIEAATDRHLWAQSYERELKDMLAVEDDVARDVARRVQVQIAPATLSRMQTHRPVNPEVYDLYLKGRFHQNRATLEELNLAIKLYEQAMTLDPDDPRPHSGIADAYTLLTEVLNVVPGSEGWPRVREQAKKALVLDPSLADAHASMGAVYFLADLKWGDAEREFRRAIELNPNYSIAHDALGVLLVARGRLDEGLKDRDESPVRRLLRAPLRRRDRPGGTGAAAGPGVLTGQLRDAHVVRDEGRLPHRGPLLRRAAPRQRARRRQAGDRGARGPGLLGARAPPRGAAAIRGDCSHLGGRGRGPARQRRSCLRADRPGVRGEPRLDGVPRRRSPVRSAAPGPALRGGAQARGAAAAVLAAAPTAPPPACASRRARLR
ncbi:MAG: hypothetical protein E6K78_09645 [Candidatus Eisenbacteria bacterium]|uniref:Protein kinase domain-containing protein n=1 Tax=Eiseniibacteriota bacterium TaxID=2212470 RepID=A0A538TKP5_UNCEI|nr:MAG: hypothetical protein E6K78_09645 [Candidatus Eisenbacteria bacterium]